MRRLLLAVIGTLFLIPELLAGQLPIILVDNDALPPSQSKMIRQVTVIQDLSQPSECALEFALPPRDHSRSGFEAGVDLEIRVPERKGSRAIFKGEIVSIESTYSSGGSTTLLVRGFNKLHRLTRGRRTRTWQNVDDARLFTRIAAGYALDFVAEDPGFRSRFVYQHNQTDLGFLRERAARIGYVIVEDGDLIRFLPASSAFPDPITLPDFSPTELTDHDVPGPLHVVVHGWDYVAKEVVEAEATADNDQVGEGATLRLEADRLSELPGNSQLIVFSRDELELLTQAVLRRKVLESRTAEGETTGDPRLRPGRKVGLEGLGDRFSGEYFVTHATHVFSRNGRYLTKIRAGREAEGR